MESLGEPGGRDEVAVVSDLDAPQKGSIPSAVTTHHANDRSRSRGNFCRVLLVNIPYRNRTVL